MSESSYVQQFFVIGNSSLWATSLQAQTDQFCERANRPAPAKMYSVRVEHGHNTLLAHN